MAWTTYYNFVRLRDALRLHRSSSTQAFTIVARSWVISRIWPRAVSPMQSSLCSKIVVVKSNTHDRLDVVDQLWQPKDRWRPMLKIPISWSFKASTNITMDCIQERFTKLREIFFLNKIQIYYNFIQGKCDLSIVHLWYKQTQHYFILFPAKMLLNNFLFVIKSCNSMARRQWKWGMLSSAKPCFRLCIYILKFSCGHIR